MTELALPTTDPSPPRPYDDSRAESERPPLGCTRVLGPSIVMAHLLISSLGCDDTDTALDTTAQSGTLGDPATTDSSASAGELTGIGQDTEQNPDDIANWQPLIVASAWRPAAIADDPRPEHRPPEVVCPDFSWYVEYGAIEVETGYCNYINLSQPLAQFVAQGSYLRLVLWHDRLVADSPATGHVALSVGGRVLWQQTVDIPSQAGIFDLTWPAAADMVAGEPIVLHLHNHGYNTWKLARFEVGIP